MPVQEQAYEYFLETGQGHCRQYFVSTSSVLCYQHRQYFVSTSSILCFNADLSRTHLNRELIQFSDGVQSRTETIQHRLDTAHLKRKIGRNQVRAIRALLTGSPEDMKRIQADNNTLIAEREQAEKELSRIKGEIKTGELKSEVVSVTTKAVKRVGSLFDNKEVRQKEQEIKALTDENNNLKSEISDLNKHIQQKASIEGRTRENSNSFPVFFQKK